MRLRAIRVLLVVARWCTQKIERLAAPVQAQETALPKLPPSPRFGDVQLELAATIAVLGDRFIEDADLRTLDLLANLADLEQQCRRIELAHEFDQAARDLAAGTFGQ